MSEKKLTEKQQAFLEHLFEGANGDIRAAMKLAGYTPSANQSDVINALHEQITERAQRYLAANAPKAAFGLVNVLNTPDALGARNAVAAAKEVLDRTGIVKKEQIQVEATGGGMFILPPKTPADDVDDQD